jgi:hypothetical protein
MIISRRIGSRDNHRTVDVGAAKLENLVRTGALKQEPMRAEELDGLKQSGMRRLCDAQREDLSFDSRFDLTYNAAHALALYALMVTKTSSGVLSTTSVVR